VIVTAFPRTVRVIEHTLISLKDGTKLAARIWLPEDAERKPVPATTIPVSFAANRGAAPIDSIPQPAPATRHVVWY